MDLLFSSFYILAISAYSLKLVQVAVSGGVSFFRPTAQCNAFLAAFPSNGSRAWGLFHVMSHAITLGRCLVASEAWVNFIAVVVVSWALTAAFLPKRLYTAAVREMAFYTFWVGNHAVLALAYAAGLQPPPSFYLFNSSHVWVFTIFVNQCVPHRFRWTVFSNASFAALSLALPILDGLRPAQSTAPPGSLVCGLATAGSSVLVMYLAHRSDQVMLSRLAGTTITVAGERSSFSKVVSAVAGWTAPPEEVLGAQRQQQQQQPQLVEAFPQPLLSQQLQLALARPAAEPYVDVSRIKYVSTVRRLRVYVKVPGAEPCEVPEGLVGRLAAHARAGDLQVTAVCVRAGCIELLVELTEQRWTAAGGGSVGEGGVVEMAASMVKALGVALPEGARLCVHWGQEQLHLVQDTGAWLLTEAPATGLPTHMLAATAGSTRAAVAGAGAPAPPAPPAVLSVSPLCVLVNAEGATAAERALPLEVRCQLSRPLLEGETLVARQGGRCLVSQVVEGAATGCSAILLEVSGVDRNAPGVVRIEVRGASGAAAGGVGVLILPDMEMAGEVGQLEADLVGLAGATSEEDVELAQALQELVLDLGAWLDFVAATSAAIAWQESGDACGRACGADSVLDLGHDLRALAACPQHRLMMAQLAAGMLDYAGQRGWTHTVQRIVKAASASGLRVLGRVASSFDLSSSSASSNTSVQVGRDMGRAQPWTVAVLDECGMGVEPAYSVRSDRLKLRASFSTPLCVCVVAAAYLLYLRYSAQAGL